MMTKRLFAGIAMACATLAATAASATTKLVLFEDGSTPVATGSFSYADGATGVLGYTDLTAFSITLVGKTYSLADVLALTDYIHFAYDTSANTFDVDPNSCGFDGCGYASELSAINSNGTFGFFFDDVSSGAPEYAEYQTGTFAPYTAFSIFAAPEPASWALMIVGIGGLGAVARSRRKAVLAA